MIDFDASPFAYDEFCSHGVVVACFVLFVGVEVGVVASFDPHVEASVVAPAFAHEFSSSEELFHVAFVDVEHEEEDLLRHFGDD